jgi:outer membrane protein assembly factor BamB
MLFEKRKRMIKSRNLIIAVLLSLTLILSACVPGPRVTGAPGISLSDDLVFVAYGNFVYGLNPTSGSVLWHFPDDRDNQVVFYAQPLVSEDYVYVGDLANNFHKLNKQTGSAEWTFTDAGGFYIGQAAEENGNVYAPNNDGKLYALDENGNLLWSFETGHYIWAQPQISRDAIFIGSMDRRVYAVSKNGDELWSVEMAGAVVGSQLLNEDGTILFVGTIGKEMVALDTTNGETLWRFETGESVWGRSILVDGSLYFSDSSGNIYALDVITGDVQWQAEVFGSVIGGLTALENGFVVATEEGLIKVFDFEGNPQWEATLKGEMLQAPAVNDEILVAGTIDGENLVYGFNLSGVQLWSTTPEN